MSAGVTVPPAASSSGPNATGMPFASNPLIAAILTMPPPIGEQWDFADRRSFIHLMWDAIENLYHTTTPIVVQPAPTPTPPPAPASNGSSSAPTDGSSTSSTGSASDGSSTSTTTASS